jgi:hypothetical protein
VVAEQAFFITLNAPQAHAKSSDAVLAAVDAFFAQAEQLVAAGS